MSGLVVIGNFDGVHRGHQALLGAVARLASERRLKPRLLTFEPHPAVTLGRPAPALLTRIERKRELSTRACPPLQLALYEFTKDFAAQSPEAFARDILQRDLDARVVKVGQNFRFGRGRSGDIHVLRNLGKRYQFEVLAEPLLSDDEGVWSSTRVRGLVADGEVEQAAQILGRPHMVSGRVVRGHQRGRSIGFPTCNLAEVAELLPAHGVYSVLVDSLRPEGFQALGRGVANLGFRPTLGESDPQPLLEVHLFDLDQDLYDANLRVHFVRRLRAERQFDGLEQLRQQIAKDSATARKQTVELLPEAQANGAWA